MLRFVIVPVAMCELVRNCADTFSRGVAHIPGK